MILKTIKFSDDGISIKEQNIFNNKEQEFSIKREAKLFDKLVKQLQQAKPYEVLDLRTSKNVTKEEFSGNKTCNLTGEFNYKNQECYYINLVLDCSIGVTTDTRTYICDCGWGNIYTHAQDNKIVACNNMKEFSRKVLDQLSLIYAQMEKDRALKKKLQNAEIDSSTKTYYEQKYGNKIT